MGIKERKERDKDHRRELILNAAGEIIATEGIENLSIRKIAIKIEYSPAIIYHYFKNKDEIVNHFMNKGYQRILSALGTVKALSDEPKQKLREMSRNYIDVALQMPDEYMSVMLNSSPKILEHTSSLFKGASSKKPALSILFQCLKDIYGEKKDDKHIELTAQIISTSFFGLIIKLIIEKDFISEEQKENLIEHHINLINDWVINGK